MIGAFIASQSGGAPCHKCGAKIPAGARVYYDGPRLEDATRTCADCVSVDLFGGSAA